MVYGNVVIGFPLVKVSELLAKDELDKLDFLQIKCGKRFLFIVVGE